MKIPPTIGPINSPISIVKLFIAEEISFAVNSSIFGSTFLIFLDKATRPGMNTGADPAPIERNPKIIEKMFFGIGGQGYRKRVPIADNISPLVYVR